MIIRSKYLSLLALLMSAAFADDISKTEFDKAQSDRLKEIQAALGRGDTAAARALARTQSQKIDEQIKKHGDFGPHQRIATIQYGTTLLSSKVLEHLKDFTSMYTGQKVSTISNTFLNNNFGIELTEVNKKWTAKAPTDLTKIVDFMTKSLDGDAKKIWDSLSAEDKKSVAKVSVDQLGAEIQSVVPADGELSGTAVAALDKKIKEKEDKISALKKDIVSAELLDESEKRMLASEKKATEAMAKEDINLTKFCEEFASGLSNPEDLQRRVDAIASSDPCSEPLKKRLATVTASAPASTTADRKPAVEEPATTGIYTDDKDEEDEEENKEEVADDSSNRKAQDRVLADQAAADKKIKDLEAQAAQLEQAAKAAMGDRDTLQNALNLSQQCQRSVGSSSDPFGLNPDNERNEKMISSLKDEMEKVLVDNYSAAVCEQAAKTGNIWSAAENVLSGLVPDGALTEADQRTLKGVSQGALNQAGAFAKKRSSRQKLIAQLQETASKRALTRLAMENSTLINMSTMGYLKTLSHTDLVGVDGMGFGGALSKASSNPLDPTLTIQVYNSLYESALMDLTKKYGAGEDYETNAECALTLAQVAGARWGQEAGRMTTLMGPARQNAVRNLSSLLTTDVKNAPSSETDTKRSPSR